jgi:hypothetical protein
MEFLSEKTTAEEEVAFGKLGDRARLWFARNFIKMI